MPTVKDLIDIFADVTGEPRTRVNQLARRLIDDGLMPKSSGSDIKQVDAASALHLLFAIAFADRVADAPAIARQIFGLRLMDDQNEDIIAGLYELFAIPPDGTLGEVAVALLDPKIKETNFQIELAREPGNIFGAQVTFQFILKKFDRKLTFIKEFSNIKSIAHFEIKFSNGDLNRVFYRVYQIGFNGFSSLRALLPVIDPFVGAPISEGGGGDG